LKVTKIEHFVRNTQAAAMKSARFARWLVMVTRGLLTFELQCAVRHRRVIQKTVVHAVVQQTVVHAIIHAVVHVLLLLLLFFLLFLLSRTGRRWCGGGSFFQHTNVLKAENRAK